ncbi:HNH endonuclease signature motif containing protein [Pigmentibacter sp. JX0631]|uniref:HNH endonuclease n=1 Tax=Pigmentibacter sp. JX0631 TaxID=2976982 RepID=UPI0024689EDC|nr:ABC-three component system protein [Pigmentibacter sp. JX0631]WGL59758.1 HNH endonuclease signature motif containing protein [Pigmentibacter sp. JX0631]
MNRSKIPDKAIKSLYGKAAGRCSFTECRKELILDGKDGASVIGEMAHIYAYGDEGPRANSSLDKLSKNSYDNLILLCPNHHTEIDKRPDKYTIESLTNMKLAHEEWISEALKENMQNVTFSELDVIIKAIANKNIPNPTQDLTLISVSTKINKNDLGKKSQEKIKYGMLKVSSVEEYLSTVLLLDADFPERLKTGFITKYNELKATSITGDDLFEEMFQFSCLNKTTDFLYSASGLAVLVYFFQNCEVFEK